MEHIKEIDITEKRRKILEKRINEGDERKFYNLYRIKTDEADAFAAHVQRNPTATMTKLIIFDKTPGDRVASYQYEIRDKIEDEFGLHISDAYLSGISPPFKELAQTYDLTVGKLKRGKTAKTRHDKREVLRNL